MLYKTFQKKAHRSTLFSIENTEIVLLTYRSPAYKGVVQSGYTNFGKRRCPKSPIHHFQVAANGRRCSNASRIQHNTGCLISSGSNRPFMKSSKQFSSIIKTEAFVSVSRTKTLVKILQLCTIRTSHALKPIVSML